MKKLLLTALLAMPLLVSAATDHEDGSITLSKDEKAAVESMVNQLLQQRQFLQMERGGRYGDHQGFAEEVRSAAAG